MNICLSIYLSVLVLSYNRMSERPPKRSATQSIREYELLKKHHKFLRESSDSENSEERNSHLNKQERKGQAIAKKYYQKLYKEFALVNLQRFESGQIGCRWRTEKEVLAEKGEKTCGQVSCKNAVQNVFQMNFGYMEQGQRKNALVKVSVCKDCAFKLNYKKKLKQVK